MKTSKKGLTGAICGILLVLLFFACKKNSEQKQTNKANSVVSVAPRKASPGNIDKVILISIDTLRADFLGCYDSKMQTTPNLDQLALESILFRDASSQSATTAPSHKSILYSLYPSIHKTTIRSVPDEHIKSPTEILKEKGFKTAAFTGGGQLNTAYGFAKGFQPYFQLTAIRKSRIRETQRPAMEWLEKNYKEKFFLFLHTYEVHCPYDPPTKFLFKYTAWYNGKVNKRDCRPNYYSPSWMKRKDYQYIRDLYAGEVNYVDTSLGQLFNRLRKLGIYGQTMIVFLSDHGESLGERGYVGHNQLYRVQLHIPLIMHIPGVPPQVIDSPVESIDVMPTIFEILGINRNTFPFEGRNLLPVIRKEVSIEKDRPVISEEIERVRVRRGDWVVNFSPSGGAPDELYNRTKDPDEITNLASKNTDLARQLKLPYFEVINRNRAVAAKFTLGPRSAPQLSEEAREQLKALGYVMQ